MKKSIFVILGVLAMAAVQPALASDDTRRVHGTHSHGPLHGDKDATQRSAMHDDGHMQHGMNKEKDVKVHASTKGYMGQMKDTFLVKKEIDGFTVSFHAMKAKEGMQHGGSHNLMIKVEKDGKALTDLMANSKVTHPNGKSESKLLMKMGDWYMAGYDLGHSGEHQLMVLFKTEDGEKHFGGVYFSEDK